MYVSDGYFYCVMKGAKMRKFFSIVGILFSCVIIFWGLQYLNLNRDYVGGRLSSPSSASGAPSYVDSGYASFGADFYTFVTNNAADAAEAVHTVASNQIQLFDQLYQLKTVFSQFFGYFLISLGGIGVCLFGCLFASPQPVIPAPAIPAPTVATVVPPSSSTPVQVADDGKPFICEACGKTFTGWYTVCPSCNVPGRMKRRS